MLTDRRNFLKASALLGSAALVGYIPEVKSSKGRTRSFSLCTNTTTLRSNPAFFDLIVDSGVNVVWMPYFLNGYYPYPIEDLLLWKERFEYKGIEVQALTVPLGHPGNSLGGLPEFESTPKNWPRGVDIDGNKYSGTSLHTAITQENISVIQKVGKAGFTKLFLDDDFRLARTPGKVGGCFCTDHQNEFLTKYGYTRMDWEQLKNDIKDRHLNSKTRNWINFTCDQLTTSFREQQAASPEVKLGIMVMYFGSEKAGIRLTDYKGSLMRVGELMFDDRAMTPVKGKTDELFSALFHRRFVSPEFAYSETTAYPADKLSAKNMAAKLHITTIADIRNTMMMSGLEPFPFTHWSTLAPAMKKAAAIHKITAGQQPKGPFKHYWGESSRMIGDDKPFSLFLASGIPFEVTDTPSNEGWTFLSDFDFSDAASNQLESKGTTFIHRAKSTQIQPALRYVAENLTDLFSFKHEIVPKLKGVPYVVEDKPVVCTWYPKIKKVLLWNLSESNDSFTVQLNDQKYPVAIAGLDAEIVNL